MGFALGQEHVDVLPVAVQGEMCYATRGRHLVMESFLLHLDCGGRGCEKNIFHVLHHLNNLKRHLEEVEMVFVV